MKSAFIAVIGRPSTGKSTLINNICAQKISIISRVPQTTRNRIRGIYTDSQGQLVFIDTPGYHTSQKKMNLYLKELVLSTFLDVDIVLYILDITRPVGVEERELAQRITQLKEKVVIAINKLDLAGKYRKELFQFINNYFSKIPIMEISALKNIGIKKLLDTLFDLAHPGELMYPPDVYTDQDPEFRVAEIIREKAINHLKQEIPHYIYVEIMDMEINAEKNHLWIRGFICVERESQKGIVIGKNGEKIRLIIKQAYEEIKRILPYKVDMDIRVKAKPKWNRNDILLKKLIH